MFRRKTVVTPLDTTIEAAVLHLQACQPGSVDHAKALETLVQLHKMKEIENPSSYSKDTLLIVGANLLGILMVINHEHLNPISTRAMQLLISPRI